MTLADRIAAVDDAIDAAAALGLDTSHAAAVATDARERLSFPGSVYVLALAGGTGVGKSSLLNALAGASVSRAGARRPTTAEPVAWVPAAARNELAPLLGWLGVRDVREHDGARSADVAILDLPDLDSIAAEHRARVDELLPRVDAVMWVADPEKYHDAVLHDAYLGAWAPRLERQLLVINKADRLGTTDAEGVARDVTGALAARGLDVPVVLASAKDGDAGIARVREWIDSGAEAKRLIAGRIAASARDAVVSLAQRAGVDAPSAPLVAPDRRERALRDVAREALALLDLRGLERQAVAATRLEARPRGAGPMGHLTAFIYRWSGRAHAAADPVGYLRRWRERGSLARPSEPLRALAAELVALVPPAVRPRVAALGDTATLGARVSEALDSAVAAQAEATPPRSIVWPVIGLAQYVVTALLLFAALWVAFALFTRVAIPVSEIPVLGAVPTPLLLLACGLVAGLVLARMLGAHAGWLGRRWARRLRRALEEDVAQRLRTSMFAPLDAIDAARERLARAASVVARDMS